MPKRKRCSTVWPYETAPHWCESCQKCKDLSKTAKAGYPCKGFALHGYAFLQNSTFSETRLRKKRSRHSAEEATGEKTQIEDDLFFAWNAKDDEEDREY
eukprot:6486819-Prorocentrum_lima.AAC.1